MGRPHGSGQTPRIRELLAAGRRPVEIADEIGCSRERVYQVNRAMASEPIERGEVKERVLALLASQTNHQIAIGLGCSQRYVALVRQEAGIAGPRAGRALTPAEPQDAARVAELASLAAPFVEDGAVAEETIELDGGAITIEPGSAGRALLTLHERQHGTAVVRVDRGQLSRVIARLAAARDALPEVATC